jgi:hypothetical protein
MAETDATNRGVGLKIAPGKGEGASVKMKISTVELAAASSGDTIDFGRIPSNARLSPQSRVYWDDLATTGSPTLDIGLRAVEGNLANANDPDALTNGHALTTATAGGATLVAVDLANAGLPAWDLGGLWNSEGCGNYPDGYCHARAVVLPRLTNRGGFRVAPLYSGLRKQHYDSTTTALRCYNGTTTVLRRDYNRNDFIGTDSLATTQRTSPIYRLNSGLPVLS